MADYPFDDDDGWPTWSPRLSFTEYEEATETTAVYKDVIAEDERRLHYLLLGLAGEAGEVSNLAKKVIRDGTDIQAFFDKLEEELGDCLWYIAQLAQYGRSGLEGIASKNLKKLEERYAVHTKG